MKRSYIAGLTVLAVVLALALAIKFIAPSILKKKILDGVKDSCPDCVLYIKNIDISLLSPGNLTFNDVRFAQGQGGHALVEVRLAELKVDIALTKSSKEKVIINRVDGDRAEVIYADGDAPEKKEPPAPESEPLHFEIRESHLRGALFRYVHTKDKRSSILHFHDIDADLSSVGNTPEVLKQMATAKLSGQIEKSGKGVLTLAALIKPFPWYVDATLELENQNLTDLNTFFTPNDGVELKGLMIHVLAKLKTRGDTTKSHVEATYRDAEYKERPTKERPGIKAAIATVAADIFMTKTNVDFPPELQKADIDVKREAGEPLVHHLLNSAKLGMLEVAKKKKKK